MHRFAFSTFVVGVFACCALHGASAIADDRPNFLIMIADDMTWSDLGYEGNQQIKTPNLDKLCTESMHLQRMFSPASTCSPSRHAIYTGLFSMRSGAYPNHTRVYDGTQSIFTLLKQQGYRVALQNKSHVGPRESFPYEHIKQADNLESTEKFIRRDKDQPWLLVYASNDPHSPWTRGPKYDPNVLKLPEYLHDNPQTRETFASYYGEITQFDTQVGNLLTLLDECGETDNTMVIFVSEQGSGLPYGGKWSLYDTGIRASTLVRWPGRIKPGTTSDALVQYVDIAPTLLEAARVDPKSIDVGCPDTNGATGFDGKSMLKLLSGQTSSLRDVIFSQHTTVGIIGYQEPYPIRAVRDSRYKLIVNLAPKNTYSIKGIHGTSLLATWEEDAKTNPPLAKRVQWLYKRPAEELYDLDVDPLETNNLALDPKYQAIKQRLRDKLTAWMQQQGDEGMETELAAKTRQNRGKKNRKAAQTKK